MASDDQSSRSADLGSMVSEHLRNTRRNLGLILLLAVSGVVALLAGPLMRSRGAGGSLCLSSVGLLLLVLAVWSGYTARRDRDLRVRVYQDGLVERRAGNEMVVPWEEIAWVNHATLQSRRAGATGRTTHLCTLQTRTGDKLQYTDATLQNVRDLCRAVEERTLEPLLRAAVSALREGRTLDFGKITADQAGIDTGRETIPWANVQDLRVEDGWVALHVDGNWRQAATRGRVNNVHVLAGLIVGSSEATGGIR